MGATDTLLGDVTVLDLTDEKGVYCTKLLADLGANVIKIEPPGGDATRSIGPFFQNEPGPGRSLYFLHFNTNKRSITLNMASEEGRGLLKRLSAKADIVVETFPPGQMAAWGVGSQALTAVNPRLIYASITPFGQTGPYRDFKATDMISLAMAGVMYLAGFPEDPPHQLGANQAYHMASLQAADGILMALYAREVSGEGQQLDVSVQEACAIAQHMASPYYDVRKWIRKRTGVVLGLGIAPGFGTFECRDGHVYCYVLNGVSAGWDVLLDWMANRGLAADLVEPEWREYVATADNSLFVLGLKTQPEVYQRYVGAYSHMRDVLTAFFKTMTKQEIYSECQARGLQIAPVNSPQDMAHDPQLTAVDYFVDLEHPELQAMLRYAGPPYFLSETPWRITRRAPQIGEHNFEVYGSLLGLAEDDLAGLKEQGVI